MLSFRNIDISKIKEDLAVTFKRFAPTILFCALLSLFLTFIYYKEDFFKDYVSRAIGIYLVTGVFVSLSIDLRRQRYGLKWIISSGIASHILILLNAFYIAYVGKTDFIVGYGGTHIIMLISKHIADIAAVVAVCVISPFIRPFFGKKDDMNLWHFFRRFIINAAKNGLIVLVLYIGLSLLTLCVAELFSVKIDDDFLLFILLGCLLFPILIMMNTPHLSELSSEKVSDKFSVALFRLFSILLCGYLLVLYAYALRILLMWELPKGLVVLPISCMMILLILIRCIAYGIDTAGQKLYGKFLKLMPMLAIPVLVLMSVGIGRRIMDYGMTVNRCYVLLFNVWSYAVCIYMILRERLMPIIGSFVVIAFLSSFGPTSAWRLLPTVEDEKSVSAESPAKNNLGTYVIHPHEKLPVGLNLVDFKQIFLAGTIDMGNSEDWQAMVEKFFADSKGSYIIYNPRQENWDASREGEMDYQVNWELEHLQNADIIIMNFLPDSKSPITLLELGLYAKTNKLRVVCPKEFYRYDNVRITCERYGVRMYESLDALLENIVLYL